MSTEKFFSIRDLQNRFGRLSVGLFLKSFRQADGYSQAEFAKILDLSKANLCDLEKGRKSVSLSRASKLAKKIGVMPEILIQLAIQDMLHRDKLKYKVTLRVA